MNKSHLTARAGVRARSSIPPPAGIRQPFPGQDELDEVGESAWMPPVFDDEISDWPEVERGAGHAASGYSELADDSLAPGVETGINLLLHGVSYR